MNRSTYRFFCIVACVVVSTVGSANLATAQNPNPDVIVGALTGPSNYAHNSALGKDAFSVGTTSCNIGTAPLLWIANNNQHPVIGQTAFRLLDGRFEQIGQSWLKHGFFALSQTLCGGCPNTTNGTTLGIACSDPYSSGLNGSQSGLGPKFEINAFTGSYPYPYTDGNQGSTGNSIYKRLQLNLSDLNPASNPGARYFVEGQYVTADDAQAGNGTNNASWREVVFSPNGAGYDMSFAAGSITTQQQPAIFAWKQIEPSVELVSADIPGEGRFWVALKVTDNGDGTFDYEYAVHNLNSDRSGKYFSVPMPQNATVTNIGFSDVDYHSGEPYSGTDWAGNHSGGVIFWTTGQFLSNPNANALRWGTLYNFRFTSDVAPGQPTIGLFKPGSPTEITVNIGGPAFGINLPNGVPAEVTPNQTTDVAVTTTNMSGAPNFTTATLFTSTNGAPFVSSPLTILGGGNFTATLPATPVFGEIDWYVSMDPLGGGPTITSPASAPASTHQSCATVGVVTFFADNFETDLGWTVVNDASLTDGAWDRGIPIGMGDRGDPATDADGSGQCYLTDNVDGDSDVDGGATRLVSPSIDLSGADNALISYAFWYDNDFGPSPNLDIFEVEASNNGGQTWLLFDTAFASPDIWSQRSFSLGGIFPALSNDFRLRFTASDLGAESIVEAGLDAVRVREVALLDEALAAGNVGANGGGGPHDVLRINGSAGGPMRRVVVGTNQPVSFEMIQIPTTPFSSPFMILAQIGIPIPSNVFDLGFGIGSLVLLPCPAAPANPFLFVLTDNIGATAPCNPLVSSNPAPWLGSAPQGIPFEVQFTVQGVVFDPTGVFNIAVTNAVVLKVVNGL